MNQIDRRSGRFHDDDRESKIRRDVSLNPRQTFVSLTSEGNQAASGMNYNMEKDSYWSERDFARTTKGEINGRGVGQTTPYHSVLEKDRRNTVIEAANKRYFRSILPIFKRTTNFAEFFKWLDSIEDYFDEIQPPENYKCKLVTYTFEAEANIWWEQLHRTRADKGEAAISSWEEMKLQLLRYCFPPVCSKLYPSKSKQEEKNGGNNSKVDETSKGSADSFMPTMCSTKCSNQLNEQKKDEMVEPICVDESMPAKCSTNVPSELHSNKQEGKDDLRSLEVSGLIYEGNDIETSKKFSPVTSLVEESEHEYPLFSKKHCVEAVTLTYPNFENNKVEEKSMDKLFEVQWSELEVQADVVVGQPRKSVFEDHKSGDESGTIDTAKALNVGSHIGNVSSVLEVVNDVTDTTAPTKYVMKHNDEKEGVIENEVAESEDQTVVIFGDQLKTDAIEGHEVGAKHDPTITAKALDEVAQLSNTFLVLSNVPKLDRLLKYDSATHVVPDNPCNLKTMIPESLVGGYISRFGSETSFATKVYNEKCDQFQRYIQLEPPDVNLLIGEMLTVSFDPGGNSTETLIVEGQGNEPTMLSSYDFIAKLFTSFSSHSTKMQKRCECPLERREVVYLLVYASTNVVDLQVSLIWTSLRVAKMMFQFVPTSVDAYTPYIKAYRHGFLSKSAEISLSPYIFLKAPNHDPSQAQPSHFLAIDTYTKPVHLMVLEYIMHILYVNDNEVFKVCLDNWSSLVMELFEAHHCLNTLVVVAKLTGSTPRGKEDAKGTDIALKPKVLLVLLIGRILIAASTELSRTMTIGSHEFPDHKVFDMVLKQGTLINTQLRTKVNFDPGGEWRNGAETLVILETKRSCGYELGMQYRYINCFVDTAPKCAEGVSTMMRYGQKNWKSWTMKALFEKGFIDAIDTSTTTYTDLLYLIEVMVHKDDTWSWQFLYLCLESGMSFAIMSQLSVDKVFICLGILCDNGKIKTTLKLFYNIVNGLDPPMNLDSDCWTRILMMLISHTRRHLMMHQLHKNKSRTILLFWVGMELM